MIDSGEEDENSIENDEQNPDVIICQVKFIL
jgi:hypothetical protein